MHFIFPLAALAATALAVPTQLLENNSVKAITGEPLLITPSGQQEQHEKRQTAAAATISLPEFRRRVLLHHNVHRTNQSAPKLTYDTDLEASAKVLSRQCKFAHNTTINGGGYGQNLAVGLTADKITSSITDLWYGSEISAYNPKWYGVAEPDMDEFGSFGHYTQVVWKGTTSVGCSVTDCSQSGVSNLGGATNIPPYMTVCNYKPAGNYVGQFKNNVGKPKGQASVSWTYGL